MLVRPGLDDRPFMERVQPFLDACPGPRWSKLGLRIMAGQPVEGIPDLESGKWMRANGFRVDHRVDRYLRSVIDVSRFLNVHRGYLSEPASRKGYQYSRALRWIRFLHGLELHRRGYRSLGLAWKIGFHDPSGWTRFVVTLTGSVPSSLPLRPMEYWVEEAIEDVWGGHRAGSEATPPAKRQKTHGFNNAGS